MGLCKALRCSLYVVQLPRGENRGKKNTTKGEEQNRAEESR